MWEGIASGGYTEHIVPKPLDELLCYVISREIFTGDLPGFEQIPNDHRLRREGDDIWWHILHLDLAANNHPQLLDKSHSQR